MPPSRPPSTSRPFTDAALVAELPRLRRYARSLTRDRTAADDLVQATVLRALDRAYLFADGTNLRGWLMTILHNQRVNDVRSTVRRPAPLDPDHLDDVPAVDDPATGLVVRDVARALARLPAEQRRALRLVGLLGATYDAAARAEGVPVGTIRSRLSRGRSTLVAALSRD